MPRMSFRLFGLLFIPVLVMLIIGLLYAALGQTASRTKSHDDVVMPLSENKPDEEHPGANNAVSVPSLPATIQGKAAQEAVSPVATEEIVETVLTDSAIPSEDTHVS